MNQPARIFAALCGLSLLVWFRPLLNTFTLAASDDRYTHILLILPLTVALIFQDWKEHSFQSELWTRSAAVLLISLVVSGFGWRQRLAGSPDAGLALEVAGLVLWWIASFILCFGRAALRTFRFPLLFLLWMIPVPPSILDQIVGVLQRESAVASQFLFSIFSVPVSRQGTTLLIPGLTIEISPECSSIRSSLMLLVTTMVLAQVLLRSPWRKALVVLFAFPLTVAKNGLRIFTIGMLATRVDESFLTGRLHRQGGIIFFLVALGLIFLLLWGLRRGERAVGTLPQLSSARS
jgi:exosortase